MNKTTTPPRKTAKTAVDDIREIRIALDKRFHGDIDKLCDHADKVAAVYQEKLRLNAVTPRRNLKHGK